MKDINSLYPRFIPIVNRFLYAVEKSEIQVVIFCARRTMAENATIYPNNPTRWSNHIAGVAVDIYPADFRFWKGTDFQKNFDRWKYWGKLREISVECGIDAPQKFNLSDKPHFQCLFETSGEILKTEFMMLKGTEDQKLANTWSYLDRHGKAA